MKKSMSTNMIEYLHASDKIMMEEYYPYLKCGQCSELMMDPKMCLTCNKNLCGKCKCSHKLVLSRHIKLILEKLVFKCKNDCGEVQLKYWDIKTHAIDCKVVKQSQVEALTGTLTTQMLTTKPDPILRPMDIDIEVITRPDEVNYDQYEGTVSIGCPKCLKMFSKKEEYIIHCKSCKNILSPNITGEKAVMEEIIKNFSESHKSIDALFKNYLCEKMSINKSQVQSKLQSSLNLIKEKREAIIKLEGHIQQNTQGPTSDDVGKDDLILMGLFEEERNLLLKKRTCQEQYNKKLEEIKATVVINNELIHKELSTYMKELIALEIEEKWAKEYLDNSCFSSDYGEKCTLCGNDSGKVMKYFCQMCRGKFCVENCIQKCKNKNCHKYICKKDSFECNLCRKNNYCDTCKKKCFYDNCFNKFCPECYRRNEHQARNSNINCKFFTCESDQVCECLMTSLFCPKCEKRLCNNCLFKDKDHYSVLKISI